MASIPSRPSYDETNVETSGQSGRESPPLVNNTRARRQQDFFEKTNDVQREQLLKELLFQHQQLQQPSIQRLLVHAKSSNAIERDRNGLRPSAVSRASTATPTSSARSSVPSINNKAAKRAKAHVFSPEEEMYMAELLADPETWSLLDGPGEKNDYNRPKKAVHEEIAQKVNFKFSTERNVVELDSTQIKNKIEHMKKQWKAANVINKRSSNGDSTNSQLRERVLEKCIFYYDVQDTWSSSWSLNPRLPVQLTENLTRRPSSDSGNDASDEEAETAVEQGDELSELLKSQSANIKKRLKRPQGDIERFITLIINLSKSSEREYDLKRQKLDLDQKTSAAVARKAEMESLLIGAQIKKIEMDMDLGRMRAEAEIARQNKLVEIEYIKAQTELKQAECYQLLEATKLERSKRQSISPHNSPSKSL
ncbi:hypothetical protein BGX27_004620 [Mortierella sp. AM989]|nr:hypothetical protein BGX27_004620 [Mortierella sp. AM989]